MGSIVKRNFFEDKALAASFVTAMMMVAVEVVPWIAFFSLGLLIWKWGVEKLGWRNLPRKVTGFLSLILLGQILLQYRTLVGQEPSYTFLLGLSGLRVMDYKNERDHRFLVLLGFVLVSIKALFSLDIYWIIPSALAFVGLWFSLLPDSHPGRLKLLGKVFILSLPTAAVLFFAFPRFVLPWAMSRGNAAGQIGFSDELNPGRVAELANVSTMAFRAKLSGLGLSTSDLYWRGSVLVGSRGLSWRPGLLGLQPQPQVSEPSNTFYEIALEPHSNTYLFVLDGTTSVQLEAGNSYSLNANVFRSVRPLTTTAVYRAGWKENSTDQTKPSAEFLETPELRGRVKEWVESVKSAHPDVDGRLEALEEFFSNSDFTYTLTPGAYGGPNELESFLFFRRRGFCEHFAGSYATLARALGIPARVVVGYHGGRYNPMGDFWRVSQRDAHAWVEVYHRDSWQRIDPTQWVAPLRLVIGADDFFDLSESEQKVFAKDIQWRPSKSLALPVWDQIQFFFDDLNYRWTYFLIDFDRTSQKSFITGLFAWRWQFLLGSAFVGILIVLVFRSLFRGKGLSKEEDVLFQDVVAWGVRHGVVREESETPLGYLNRLSQEKPTVAEVLGRIQRYYDERAYQMKTSAGEGPRLLRAWRRATKNQMS